MAIARANNLDLFYETAGDPSGPTILLIAGLGVQSIDWPDYLVDPLIEAGFHIVRFDNRDIGLSTTFDDAPSDPQVVMTSLLSGEEPEVAYTLADMADDAAALLDALAIDQAHVVGVSMGGMIAQSLAIQHPDKVASLTSIMSSTGSSEVGQPTPEALEAILAPGAGDDRAALIAHNIKNAKVWASPDHFDADRLEASFIAALDRVGAPQAVNSGRQFCAIVASPARDEALANLTMPTLVVHGDADPLVTPSGGARTAELVADAELLVIPGMGHDLVPAFTPQIVAAMQALVARSAA